MKPCFTPFTIFIVTIKVDPLQIVAIKKLSNMKSIPYQTLIRHWLAEGIKQEMDSVLK